MAQGERKKIGIVYNTNPSWMGGVIYTLNSIKVLNWLEDERKPEIVVFYRKELKRFLNEIDYPYLTTIEVSFPSISKIYLQSLIKRKNVLVEMLMKLHRVDAFFPVFDLPLRSKKGPQLVSWYADLQHKYYPQFFTLRKRIERDLRIRFMLRNGQDLVVSSQAVLDDFHEFFNLKKIRPHVYHFTSIIDGFEMPDFNEVRNENGLPEKYFMVANQFHPHKNHKVILEALALLKQKGQKCFVAFTGRLPENEDKPHIKELHRLMEQHDLKDQVKFLGVISRPNQLCLLKNAQCIIQPSLFEGWSTVIEDAMSLQVPVIASSLKVNMEQLGEKGNYFDPLNAQELSDKMSSQPDRKELDENIYPLYDDRMAEAANSLILVFEQ